MKRVIGTICIALSLAGCGKGESKTYEQVKALKDKCASLGGEAFTSGIFNEVRTVGCKIGNDYFKEGKY